uniref:Uncharacterized protein n=1 Tax=Sinocyclocheilus grahami TaxID=75366 RepID=A0A672NYE5_SINGR
VPAAGRLEQSSSAVVRLSASGGVWAALGSLLYPLLSVWRFISGFLFSSAPPAPAPPAAQNDSRLFNVSENPTSNCALFCKRIRGKMK